MTDEVNKEPANVGNVVPGEAPAKTPTGEPEVRYTDEEVRALEGGWIPPDQWKGDPKDHRSAREFNDRGELLGKLKAQGSQLREVTEMLKHLAMHNQKVYENSYKDALAKLTQQKYAAVQEGDVTKVAQIDDAIDRTRQAAFQAQQQAPQAQQGPSPEFQEWSTREKWYLTDTSLRHWANGMAIDYARVNPTATEPEILKFLATEVRKEFPHKMGRVGAPNPDSPGRAANTNKTVPTGDAFEKLMSTFDEHAAHVARNLVKFGHVSKEDYVKQYTAISKER